MTEQMQVWVRLYGPEHFKGELDYLLGIRALLKRSDEPILAWRVATHSSDATVIQGSTVQRWGRQQRQFHPQQAQHLPDLARPFAVMEPTLASVPASLRCDPRSRDALLALWDMFDAELAPIRLKFSIGQRCFELLSRIQNRFTSQAQYQLDHPEGTVANLQPASAQLHLSPLARPSCALQATWRRRPASTLVNERFEQLPLPQALGVYCQRTTRRLFSTRLRTARICVRAQAVIRLADHSDQNLAILVQLQAGYRQFIDIAQQLGWDEHSLGNALLGLYLSGIVEFDLEASINTLFASEPRKVQRPKALIELKSA